MERYEVMVELFTRVPDIICCQRGVEEEEGRREGTGALWSREKRETNWRR